MYIISLSKFSEAILKLYEENKRNFISNYYCTKKVRVDGCHDMIVHPMFGIGIFIDPQSPYVYITRFGLSPFFIKISHTSRTPCLLSFIFYYPNTNLSNRTGTPSIKITRRSDCSIIHFKFKIFSFFVFCFKIHVHSLFSRSIM